MNTAAITRVLPNTVARQAVYRDAARNTLVILGASLTHAEELEDEELVPSSNGMYESKKIEHKDLFKIIF